MILLSIYFGSVNLRFLFEIIKIGLEVLGKLFYYIIMLDVYICNRKRIIFFKEKI